VSVFVASGAQTGLARLVVASTTTTMPDVPVMPNPNRLVRTPKLAPPILSPGNLFSTGARLDQVLSAFFASLRLNARPPTVRPQWSLCGLPGTRRMGPALEERFQNGACSNGVAAEKTQRHEARRADSSRAAKSTHLCNRCNLWLTLSHASPLCRLLRPRPVIPPLTRAASPADGLPGYGSAGAAPLRRRRVRC